MHCSRRLPRLPSAPLRPWIATVSPRFRYATTSRRTCRVVTPSRSAACRWAEFIGKGLRALGHETFEVDADRIERSLGALARADLVFDATDTVAGRGLFRAVVRGLLEQRGARVAGASAAACLRADDKV